ncbi:MAG: hypothetical protein AAB518_03500 [Patescibacteria group bacterium]
MHRIEIIGLNERDRATLIADLRTLAFQRPRTRILGIDNYFAWPDSIDLFSAAYRAATVEKNIFTRSLTISALPRKRFAAWCPENSGAEIDCRWIDGDDGIFLETTARPEGQLVPTITEKTTVSPSFGGEFLTGVRLNRIKLILDFLRINMLSIEEIKLNRDFEEIQVISSDHAVFRFSIRFDPAVNLSGFREILKTTGTRHIQELNLTVPGKVYLTKR